MPRWGHIATTSAILGLRYFCCIVLVILLGHDTLVLVRRLRCFCFKDMSRFLFWACGPVLGMHAGLKATFSIHTSFFFFAKFSIHTSI